MSVDPKNLHVDLCKGTFGGRAAERRSRFWILTFRLFRSLKEFGENQEDVFGFINLDNLSRLRQVSELYSYQYLEPRTPRSGN